MIVGIGVWAGMGPGTEHAIGSYTTSLAERTQSQIFNARIAVRKINGIVIQPGQEFSFLRTVGPWTADMGYRKAPVSYDGELIKDWGGGVCQVSTTLYNAALMAGLEVTERHHHHWPARYAPLGRDAAVAYEDIDLKFRNNLSAPVRIVGIIRGENMVFRIDSAYKPNFTVRIDSETKAVTQPNEILQDRTTDGEGRWRLVNRGHPGFEVATYRTISSTKGSRRELLSDDQYPAMSRIMRVEAREQE